MSACATLRRHMTQTLNPPTADAKVVEGSDGLLLEIDGQIVPNYDATFAPFEEGEVVSGRVVRIDNDEVLVDIGYKSEGVIPSNELSIRKNVDPHDEVELGEEVDALVLTKEDQDGRLIMSKKRARFEKAWRRIEAAAESGDPVEGTVIEVVKGGLIIDLGVRGFLPASLVDIRRVPNLDEYMGTKIETKVIELNRSRNNVVLSRRAVLEEERKEQRQEILDQLQPGMIVEGQISNIVDFGAFVDLNGIDGLIHISELSWSHVNHPSEVINIGDTVQVKVLDIDRDRQRISLGLKQTQEDPWQRVVDTYNVGDELEGTVTKVVTFGAFVEILDGVEGLVHISELANHHVENPREVVQPGDDVKVRILEIDTERRRLSLSVKRVEGQILPSRVPEGPQAVSEGAGDLDDLPDLALSEDVFSGAAPAAAEEQPEAAAAVAEPEAAAAEPEAAEAAAEPAAAGRARGGGEPRGAAAAAAEPEAAARPSLRRPWLSPSLRRRPSLRRPWLSLSLRRRLSPRHRQLSPRRPLSPRRRPRRPLSPRLRPSPQRLWSRPSRRRRRPTRRPEPAGPSPRPLRRADRRAGRGQVDGARRARASGRGDDLRRRRRPRALRLRRGARCRHRALGPRGGARRHRRPRRGGSAGLRGAGRARVARGAAVAAGGRARRAVARRARRRGPAAARRGRRDPAALRGRPGGRLRRHHRGRRRRGRARRACRRARPPRGRRAVRAPTLAGGESGPGDVRGRKQRNRRAAGACAGRRP